MDRITSFLNDRTASARRDLLILAITFSVVLFQFLGRLPLMEPDEGRYSEIPREMLARGDFITPLLNYVKYFEKPPLLYWLNALSMTVFGENEFAARFPGAFCGLLTILFTYHLGRKLFGRQEGLAAALILGSSAGFIGLGRVNLTDMTLTFCMTVSIGCFLLASRPGEARQGLYYHLFYVFAACALLAKGLIGFVLPGGVLFFYMLFCRRWSLLREMRLLTGLPLFFAMAAPWFVLVSLRNPEFARFFFIHEHFERFLTKVHRRYEPFWFFIPVLFLTMFPWALYVPQALVGSWRNRKTANGDTLLYLLLWAGFIFLFFSKSNSKLIPYILPVFCPLALLVGQLFTRAAADVKMSRITGMLLALLLAVIGCGSIVYPQVTAKPYLTVVAAAVLGGALLGEGLLVYLAVRRGAGRRLFLILVASGLLLSLVGPWLLLPSISAAKASSKDLCLMVRAVAGPETVVASLGYEQGLPFYARQRVVVVGGMGELEFGSKIGDQSAWFIDAEKLVHLWDSPRHVVLLLRANELELFAPIFRSPVRVLGQDQRKLLVTNR